MLDDFLLILDLFDAETKVFRVGLNPSIPGMCVSGLDHLMRKCGTFCSRQFYRDRHPVRVHLSSARPEMWTFGFALKVRL